METRAFAPMYTPSAGNAQGTISPSTTITASVAAATNAAPFSGNTGSNYQQQMQIANTTTSWAYVNFGVFGNVLAATVAASYPVAPGAVVVVTVDKEVSAASVILGVAPGTLTGVIFTRGEGV